MNRRHFSALLLAAGFAGLSLPVAAQQAAAAGPTILVVGDSLSAEYGLQRGAGWVALLEKKLAAEKLPAQVVNASISGDTTSGGRSRLPGLLARHKPQVVVLELGGNDALRGLPLNGTQANLDWMAKASQDAGAKVLVVGMQMPPNYGADYGRKFEAVFAQVAKDRKTALVPFMLKGVADRPDPREMFQADGIHPVAQAHPTILATIWPELRPLLR